MVLEGDANTPKDFEPTKLLVNIDSEPPVQVNIGIVLVDNCPNRSFHPIMKYANLFYNFSVFYHFDYLLIIFF